MSLRTSDFRSTKTRGCSALALYAVMLTGPVLAADNAPPPSLSTDAPTSPVEAPAASTPTASISADRLSIDARTSLPDSPMGKGDEVLRLVQRSTTGNVAAAYTAVNVLTGLLGGGVKVGSFHKDQLKGTKIDSIPNPALAALPGAFRNRLDAYFEQHRDALPAEHRAMQIDAGDWLLVYQKLSDADTQYELRFQAHVGVPPKKLGFMKFERSNISMSCQPEPKVASLEQWQAEDYALVKSTANAYVEECAEHFAQALPGWFPDSATSPSASEKS